MVILMVRVTFQSQLFKQRYQGLRKDQPIYLCDANGIASYRAARILRKNGYKDLYMLKGGYKMDR